MSYRSNENVAQLFCKMFPDSAIAQKFSCGERKTAYLCVFGIPPYLKDLMLTKVKGQGPFVSFDESIHKKSQKKQTFTSVSGEKEAKSSYAILVHNF